MGGLIAYVGFTGGFVGLALALYFAFKTIKLI
jgi:hypothetical protein